MPKYLFFLLFLQIAWFTFEKIKTYSFLKLKDGVLEETHNASFFFSSFSKSYVLYNVIEIDNRKKTLLFKKKEGNIAAR